MVNNILKRSLTSSDLSDENYSYLVDFQGEGEILVISFGFYAYNAIPNFDFFGRLKKVELRTGKKINKLFLRDKKNFWYHHGIENLGTNVDETILEIKKIIEQIKPSKIFTIGQSMGAYAAIMFGSLLKVDTVLAFGSLAFFDSDRASTISDTRWLTVMQEVEKQPPQIFYKDLKEVIKLSPYTNIELYFGNMGDGLDKLHAEYLEKVDNVNLHSYPTDHLIVNHLKSIGKIDKILATTFFGENIILNNKTHITNDWKKWAFENIAKGANAENLVSIMVEKGLDEQASRELLVEISASPYLAVTKQYQEKLQKREWLLKTLDWHKRQIPDYTQPQKVPLPPFKQFLEEYYFQNKIGIFSGAIDHWGAAKWTFPDLVSKVGYDSMVEVQTGREKEQDYEVKGPTLKTQIKFGEFIDKITSVDSSNDMYMTANNHPFQNPAMQKLLPDFDNIGDNYFNMDDFASRAFLWLGPKGVITPLHHDLTNNFFIQVYGKKVYHLIPSMQAPYMYDSVHVYSDVKLLESDLNQYPEFKKTSIIQVELEPGDSLFIPIGYWHHVVGLTPNISLTITNMNVNNNFPR